MQFRANQGSSAMTRWKTQQLATKTRPTRLQVWHKFLLASLKQRIISQRIIAKFVTQMLRQQNLNCSRLWTLEYWGSSWLTSEEAFPPDLRQIFYVFTGPSLQHVCGEGERQRQKKGGRKRQEGRREGRERDRRRGGLNVSHLSRPILPDYSLTPWTHLALILFLETVSYLNC